jgi:hypothetical protein
MNTSATLFADLWMRFAPAIGFGVMIETMFIEIGLVKNFDIVSGDALSKFGLHLSITRNEFGH